MSKKAYLVDFIMATRVIVDSEATEDEVIDIAFNKIKGAIHDYFTKENCIDVSEDFEVPYDEDTD